MKLGYDLKLEQSQKLIMTPELRQAIELLQLNTVELRDYINRELEENPMLESKNQLEESESLEEHTVSDEVDWSEYFDKSNSYEYRDEIDKNIEQFNFESFIKYEPSLSDYLLTQLNLLDLDPIGRIVGETIIQNLDDDGYLVVETSEIASELRIDEGFIEKVLEKIQKFDPRGIGARSLEECLLNQLDKELYIKGTKEVIQYHLEDIAYNRTQKISKNLNIKEIEVEKILDYIRSLEPKPGRSLSSACDEVKYITPDAEIKLVDGEFKVILNEATGPRLNINSFYKRMMKSNNDKNAKQFLNDRFNRAMWVIQSIEQRRQTIKKVLESIVKFQKEFLLEGEKFLRPMNMKEVAEDIEMHESTVSRATTGKYVQTPQGLFELKYFFTTGLLGINGDVSAISIKSSIKDLIDHENPDKPLSDQRISDILKENGTRVSRRTVAKYRNEMHILSSSMRRGL